MQCREEVKGKGMFLSFSCISQNCPVLGLYSLPLFTALSEGIYVVIN